LVDRNNQVSQEKTKYSKCKYKENNGDFLVRGITDHIINYVPIFKKHCMEYAKKTLTNIIKIGNSIIKIWII
jgi:hypothetical protein